MGKAAGGKRRLAVRGILLLLLLFDGAAIYYSTIEPRALLLGLTIIFLAGAAGTLWLLPFRLGVPLCALLSMAVFLWFLFEPPSNNRDWSPEYAIPATATVQDGIVTIDHIRDFAYAPDGAQVPHYYDAIFHLDQLYSVDLVASYWAGEAIAHIFLTFNFTDGQHVAISIETRRQKRFQYSAIAGFFRHYELFYVVADERDLIGVRTDVRGERVYLYRLQLPPARAQKLFLNYVAKFQALAVHPQWYNTLTDNCTTGILARADVPAGFRMNWHMVLSGYVPEYAYTHGLLTRQVDFATLRAGSRITRPPGGVIGPDFSQAIRAGLTYYPQP